MWNWEAKAAQTLTESFDRAIYVFIKFCNFLEYGEAGCSKFIGKTSLFLCSHIILKC